MTDPYEVLGVARDAGDEDIRKKYRKLARKYHPDVNPGDSKAEDKFKEISSAYEILSDTERRKSFDEFGEASTRSGFDAEQARAHQSWQQARKQTGHPFEAESGAFDLHDLRDLGDLFGRYGRGRSRPQPQRAQRGGDIHATVEVDLATALRGSEVEVAVPIEEPCAVCHALGVDPAKARDCPACGGTGQSRVARGPLQMVAACDRCGGSGKVGPACSACGGAGQTSRVRKTRIRIPPGADTGDILRIAGKGLAGPGGTGDLLIETRVKPHKLVTRKGRNLTMSLPITLDEAYNGATIRVPTFDGEVSLKIPAGSQPGTKLRLRGKGVHRKKHRGDFFVKLDVRLPDKHAETLGEALRAASDLYSRPVRAEVKL